LLDTAEGDSELLTDQSPCSDSLVWTPLPRFSLVVDDLLERSPKRFLSVLPSSSVKEGVELSESESLPEARVSFGAFPRFFLSATVGFEAFLLGNDTPALLLSEELDESAPFADVSFVPDLTPAVPSDSSLLEADFRFGEVDTLAPFGSEELLSLNESSPFADEPSEPARFASDLSLYVLNFDFVAVDSLLFSDALLS
jgi:hypothetical protein